MRLGVELGVVHPDCGGPEGEKHEYSLIRGRPGQIARHATNDLTHGLRRQAARRARKQAPL